MERLKRPSKQRRACLQHGRNDQVARGGGDQASQPITPKTLSKKNAAVAAAKSQTVSASVSQEECSVQRGQLQLHRNQLYVLDSVLHREARSRTCHRIRGRERVNSVEDSMTAFAQQPVTLVISSSCIQAVTRSSSAAGNSTME